ncbi:hypothetical protein [Haloarcula argentinensis]|uniref:Uncharacterized protein n=1 Tax=Haloarcula argentinensis TaxID=43776 RepID=A0A847UIG1_HALAR|nr:hypothetical protein [Haloarcula argentinensis]NLV13229.1 hypothetical protein [Haloarcula argentinensis]
MSDEVSTRTLETEGYSPDEWLPVLKPFYDQRFWEPLWPDSLSLEDYLEHEENKTGGNPRFESRTGFATLYLRYSPYLRSEHDVMLRGDLQLNKNWGGRTLDASELQNIQESIQGQYMFSSTTYLSLVNLQEDEQSVLSIEVPESFSTPEYLSDIHSFKEVLEKTKREVSQ